MRFGLCTDIKKVKEVEELGFDYVEGKLNQLALWPQEEFDEVFARVYESKGPVVIDCKIDKDEFVLPMVPPGAPRRA